MTHEEARRRLRLGADAEAEAHVAGCSACFAAIERGDTLLLALRRARPDPVAPPLSLAARVLSRWTFRRRLPWRTSRTPRRRSLSTSRARSERLSCFGISDATAFGVDGMLSRRGAKPPSA